MVIVTRFSTAALPILLAACATAPELVAPGEQVTIVVEGGRYARDSTIQISNRNIGRGAGAGFVGGAALGAVASLGCGPWFFLCAGPFSAVLGGTGAAAGAVVGSAQGIPEEARERVRERLESYRQDRQPTEDLAAAIAQEARKHWVVVPSDALTTVTVRIDEVAAHSIEGERMSVSVRVAFGLSRTGAGSAGERRMRSLVYRSPTTPMRLWIEDRDGFIANAFGEAYRHIAQSVVSELGK